MKTKKLLAWITLSALAFSNILSTNFALANISEKNIDKKLCEYKNNDILHFSTNSKNLFAVIKDDNWKKILIINDKVMNNDLEFDELKINNYNKQIVRSHIITDDNFIAGGQLEEIDENNFIEEKLKKLNINWIVEVNYLYKKINRKKEASISNLVKYFQNWKIVGEKKEIFVRSIDDKILIGPVLNSNGNDIFTAEWLTWAWDTVIIKKNGNNIATINKYNSTNFSTSYEWQTVNHNITNIFVDEK